MNVSHITKSMESPHPQAPILGFAGNFMSPEENADMEASPWTDPPDPGCTTIFPNDAFMTENQHHNIRASFQAASFDHINLKNYICVMKHSLN